jgi:hypothetical protein
MRRPRRSRELTMLRWIFHVLVPTLTILMLALVAWMGVSWSSQQLPKAASRVASSPTPQKSFQILAIAVTPRATERKVLVRQLKTGVILAVGMGEEISPGGGRVAQINHGAVVLRAKDGKTHTRKIGESLH